MSDAWWKKYQVDLPEGERGDWRVERFEFREADSPLFNMRLAFSGQAGRTIPDGTYTRLRHKTRGVVMSDTLAEIGDHSELFGVLERGPWAPNGRRSGELPRRVLIHGLGIGMSLRWALLQPHVEHVDVVEIDHDVRHLVGFHYQEMSHRLGKKLVIHWGDALRYRFPRGTRWDVVWHDVWDEINLDNLEQVARLKRRYGRAAGWQGAWAEPELRRLQRQARYSPWYEAERRLERQVRAEIVTAQ